ncbi:MAG: hypothetical protein EOP00_32295, partial [Pedobacter sp.]
MAPLIAEVKCGHTRLILVTKKLTKYEKDSLANLGKPISQFSYKVLDHKLYVTAVNKKIATVKKGSEILSINDISTNEIISNLTKNYASDGYNQTFKPAVLNRAFVNWYTNIYENKDTLHFKIKKSDSIFTIKVTTIKKEEKKDSLEIKKPVIKLSKDSLLAKKKIAKEKLKVRYKGSDEFKKPLLDLKFLAQDSSVAYLKVKSFSFPYADFDRFFKEFDTRKLIVKPCISGGAKNTFKVTDANKKEVAKKLPQLIQEEDFIMQPFLPEILEKGEWSFIFFNGSYSHSLIKQAKAGDFRVQPAHGGTVHPQNPSQNLIDIAAKYVNQFAKDCLYARVDGTFVNNNFLL